MSIHSSRILYEDDHLLAVSKLSGELVVQGSGKVQKKALLDFLKVDHSELKALHRLDFETSGVVLFAKTKEAEHAVLNSKFSGWQKTYHALLMGRIERPTGSIHKALPARGKGTVTAETHYKVLDRFANSTYVEVEMKTGRHHQIRRHFAAISHPLALDELYGHTKFNQVFTREFGYKRFFLHAHTLQIPHPITKKQIAISAPLPHHFADALKALRSL